MTLFTSQSAIACALAAAITFGGGAAHADTLPDTRTASATPAPTETAPTETPAAAETSAPTEPPAATPSPFASHALEVRGLGPQVLNIAHTDPGNDPKVNQSIEASLADWGHDRNGGVFFISI
ncbi:MAG: hypothetical protein ABWY53_10685 [Leifsonia flava]